MPLDQLKTKSAITILTKPNTSYALLVTKQVQISHPSSHRQSLLGRHSILEVIVTVLILAFTLTLFHSTMPSSTKPTSQTSAFITPLPPLSSTLSSTTPPLPPPPRPTCPLPNSPSDREKSLFPFYRGVLGSKMEKNPRERKFLGFKWTWRSSAVMDATTAVWDAVG